MASVYTESEVEGFRFRYSLVPPISFLRPPISRDGTGKAGDCEDSDEHRCS